METLGVGYRHILCLLLAAVSLSYGGVKQPRPIIPASRLREVSALANRSATYQLLQKYIAVSTPAPAAGRAAKTTRVVSAEIWNAVAPFASTGGCKPRTMVVPLEPSQGDDPNVFYFPPCTEVMRCSGCCDYPPQTCVSDGTEIVQRQVLRLINNPMTGAVEFDGHVSVSVVQHHNCSCRCAISPEDCRPPLHHYDPTACRCLCLHQSPCPQYKLWNEKTCMCVCREIRHCLEDEMFDFVTCTCQVRFQTALGGSASSVTSNCLLVKLFLIFVLVLILRR